MFRSRSADIISEADVRAGKPKRGEPTWAGPRLLEPCDATLPPPEELPIAD